MKKIKSIIGVIVIFLLGTFCGALGAHIVYKTHINKYISGDMNYYQEMIVRSLSRKLDLDEDQREKVKRLVNEAQIEIQSVRKQYRPQIQNILENNRLKIRMILRSDQIENFDRIIKHYKAKANKNYE